MRTPSVTRSFRCTNVNAFFVNTATKETYEKTFTLPRTFKTEKEIIKTCAKQGLYSGDERLVTILSFESAVRKYTMTETDFIAHATEVK